MVKQIFNKKTSKKVVAALMSAALVGAMAPVTLPTQMVQVEAADEATPGGNNENHVFVDWNTQTEATAVTSGSIRAYVNGANVKISKDEKFNYKQSTVYTDITGTYHYELDSKNKLKASTGKVVAIVSTSSNYATGYDDEKNKYYTKDPAIVGAKNIAKATIKSGIVTITAGTEAKAAYLHIVDTGNAAKNHETVPINIIPAAAKIAITTGSAINTETDIKNKKVDANKEIKKASLNAGEDVVVYANALYTKDNNQIATGSSIEAKVDDKNKEYFAVEPVADKSKDGQAAFKITCLKTKEDGKTSSATITFSCKESGKKATLRMTGTSQLKTIGATTSTTGVTVDNTDKAKVTVNAPTATGTAISVVYDLVVTDVYQAAGKTEKTTDKLKISAVLTKPEVKWNTKGDKVDETNKAASSSKVTAKLSGEKVTVKVDKKAVAGTYYVVVYTSTSGKNGATKLLTVDVK